MRIDATQLYQNPKLHCLKFSHGLPALALFMGWFKRVWLGFGPKPRDHKLVRVGQGFTGWWLIFYSMVWAGQYRFCGFDMG